MLTRGKAHRVLALAGACAASALVLAGCIGTPVTVTGSGVVTVSWIGTAEGFTAGKGDTFQICAATAASCMPTSPDLLYVYYPANLSTEATLQVGTPVTTPLGASATLPSGDFTMQVVYTDPAATPTTVARDRLFSITIGNSDRPIWLQSIARESNDGTCPRNWDPSWAQWPNDGTGGFVCNREMYADADDEEVPDQPRAARGAPWMQSTARASSDDACPDGWSPSWAQWPNDNTGGPTCTRMG